MNGSGMSESVLSDWKRQLNLHSSMREILVDRLMKFPLSTVEKMKLQASTLAQLTQTTNQLTRITLVNQVFLFLLFSCCDGGIDDGVGAMLCDHLEDLVDVSRDLVR